MTTKYLFTQLEVTSGRYGVTAAELVGEYAGYAGDDAWQCDGCAICDERYAAEQILARRLFPGHAA